MKIVLNNRQAAAFNSFLGAAILVDIFEKMPTKIAALKDERSGEQQKKDSGNLFNEENR